MGKGLASYNTSICMMALMQSKKQKDESIIQAARKFLINQQSDFDTKGETDSVFDGGVGYGSRWAIQIFPIHTWLWKLYFTQKNLSKQRRGGVGLDWDAAITFVSKCQSYLPLIKRNGSVITRKIAEDLLFSGVAWLGRQKKMGRPWRSWEYELCWPALFHLCRNGFTRSRVLAVKEWLTKHYTIKENPGMGPQGLFYYYHTMAKALTLSGITTIKDENGDPKDWRKELCFHLLNLQSKDGSWVNDNGRWWEKTPCWLLLTHC